MTFVILGFDNDLSLALALSQQLDLEQMGTGTAKTGSNTTHSSNNKGTKMNNIPAVNHQQSSLFGGDSIYSNYLKSLSVLDSNGNDAISSGLSTSMFDSILGNTSTTNTTHQSSKTTTNASQYTSPVVQKVLDSDISDSDEDSKNSDDSDEDDTVDILNINGKPQRRTKGARPIMERRAQDNRLLVQRKIDNWSNKVDPESNRVESNESMIERMKDRHRNQVKLAALRNQQQIQDEQRNLMGYPQQQQQQHMVPQSYVAPNVLSSTNATILQHPGVMMDPATMYYPNAPLFNVDYAGMSLNQPQQLPSDNMTSPPPIPPAFLPNPTHLSLSVPHPPSKEQAENLDDQHMHHAYDTRHQKNNNNNTHAPMKNGNNVMMNQSTNNSHTNSITNNGNVRTSTPPSSAGSSTYSEKNPSASTVTLECIDDIDNANPPAMHQEPVTPLKDSTEGAAEEADCELSGDEVAVSSSSPSRRKKSIKKLRQSKTNPQIAHNNTSPADDDMVYDSKKIMRPSRSTPNLKKSKKKNSSSRSSSRRNSQDYTTVSPSSEMMIATPPPLPISPHNYNNSNSEESLSGNGMPRSNSHNQFQHHQQQQQKHQLRHMKSEPDLPRRSNSAYSTQTVSYQQQKLYQQQQQLDLEWKRMQNFQRELMLKQRVQQQPIPSQPTSYAPMYGSVYYPGSSTPPVMINPQQQQFPHNYDLYPYPVNGDIPPMSQQQYHQQFYQGKTQYYAHHQ